MNKNRQLKNIFQKEKRNKANQHGAQRRCYPTGNDLSRDRPINSAPDFTADYMKYATPAQIEEMEKFGKISYPGQNITFTVTKRLIDSGNENLVLDKESIDILCPVVLIQGMQDTSVDWHKALKIAERVKTNDVIVKLLKNTGHRLNDDFAINEILSALDTFL